MSYRDIAARFRLSVCWGGCGRASDERHELGWYDQHYGQVHWFDRNINRRGLRRFLKLAITSMLGLSFVDEPERTYWQVIGAEDLARQLHVRFPRRYADADRAAVRTALKTTRLNEDTRRMIERWAR